MQLSDIWRRYAASDVSAESDLPSKRSAASERQLPALELCRDVFLGAERIRERGNTYLPRSPGEKPENYLTRLSRSAFTNYYRRTIDGLAGMVFAKDPKLSDDVPLAIREHWENLDNAGTHGDVFCRDLLTDALVAGHSAILVEFPPSDGNLSAAEERALGLRPYWVPIRKEDIISWRPIVEDGRTIFEQVVLRERIVVPKGEFGEESQERFRIFRRAMKKTFLGIPHPEISYAVLKIDRNGKVDVGDTGVYSNQVEIPIVEVPTSGRIGLFESQPPALDIAYLNIAHYQQDSDHVFALHMGSVPILARFGAQNIDGITSEMVVGPNAALDLPKDARLEYVTPNSGALDAAARAMEKILSAIGSLGLAMLAPQKRSAETAEAKRLDKATSDSALAVAARALQDAIERALQLHARYLLLEDGGSVQINRDFQSSLMEPAVLTAIANLVKTGLPISLALKMMLEGGRIPEDSDLAALEMEWAAGTAAREEQLKLDAEDRASNLEAA